MVYFPNLIQELKQDNRPIKQIEFILSEIVACWRALLYKRYPNYDKFCKKFLKNNYKEDKEFYHFIAEEDNLKY